MALDFHIANDKKTATYQSANTSFDLQSHVQVFNQSSLLEGKFPLFKRMEDFYKDTKYNLGELDIFIKELKEVKQLFSGNNQLIQQLDNLSVVCEKALKENKSIWVFCD